MRIRCKLVVEGPGPSEAVVAVKTARGPLEEVVVYTGLLQNEQLEVGPFLGSRDGQTLIELPRESASGRWRIWVPNSEVIKEREVA